MEVRDIPQQYLPWLGLAGIVFYGAACAALAMAVVYVVRARDAGTLRWNQVPPLPTLSTIEAQGLIVLVVAVWALVPWLFYLAILCIPLLLSKRHGIDLASFWGLGRFSLPRIVGTSGWVYLSVMAVFIPLSVAWAVAVAYFHLPIQQQAAVEYMLTLKDPARLAIMFVMAVCIAPCAEEILFRGTLLPLLKRHWSSLPALVVTSVIFAALHLPSLFVFGWGGVALVPNAAAILVGSIAMLVQLFLLSMVLGGLYEHTGSLPLCIGLHSVFNCATTLAVGLMKLLIA